MSLEDKKIVRLVEANFDGDELTKPLKAMKEDGAKVAIVGSRAGVKYRGKRHRLSILFDAGADEINTHDSDAVVIPRGYAPDKTRLHQPLY